MTVLIQRRAQDHAEDRISISDRLGKTFQQHHPGAFTPHETARARIECSATPFRRKHGRLRKTNEPTGRDHHRDTASHGGIAASSPDMFAGRVNSGQRGRTGRVHGDARAAQIQAIGNSIRGDRVSASRGGMRRDPVMIERRALHSLIVVMGNADEDADVAALFEIEDQPGIFDRLPCGLEQQPVLRIHIRRFPRRNAEELRIELIDLVQEAGPLGESLSRDPRLGIVVAFHIPTIWRDLADGIRAFEQQLPEGFGVVHPSWKAASNSDDGNAVFMHGKA